MKCIDSGFALVRTSAFHLHQYVRLTLQPQQHVKQLQTLDHHLRHVRDQFRPHWKKTKTIK